MQNKSNRNLSVVFSTIHINDKVFYIYMKYRIHVEQDEDGMFIANCPTLPGCVSQGKSRKEALKNISDAIEGYLESLKKHNDPIPPAIEEEVIEVDG